MKKFLLTVLLLVATTSVVKAKTFEDVEELNCRAAVESLEHIGIVNGVSSDKYAPQKSVTRAELSKMVVNALKIDNSNTKTFLDVKNHWGEKYIEQAAGEGILNGYTDGTFRPDKEVTYAEAIAILLRSLDYHNLESVSGKWYDNYITKMEEIGLNDGIENISPEEFANRGDIAILLWNAIKSDANGKPILDNNFSNGDYIKDKKITDITTNKGKIIYRVGDAFFYVENGIDFGDIGGLASGFLNKEDNTISGLEVDNGKNLKRISGSTDSIKEMGYDVFNCKNIYGYGTKEKAKYVEIFTNKDTNKVERVVYYDTTESHFAEKLKIGASKISIDSKDVYDTSIVIHNGQTYTYKMLRNESVKDIDANALIVNNGKIVSWASVPANSVIREIKKDSIYTYINKHMDVSIESLNITTKRVSVNGTYYVFSKDCIFENTESEVAVRLEDNFTNADLRLIVRKDKTNRIYFNEFNEIVKFEYKYSSEKQDEVKEKELEDARARAELERIGIVSDVKFVLDDATNKNYHYDIQIISKPKTSSLKREKSSYEEKIGKFVYLTSGDSKIVQAGKYTNYDYIKAIENYDGFIKDNYLGNYRVSNSTEYIEVQLEKSSEVKGEYTKCNLKSITEDDLGENHKYKTLHLVLSKDLVVLRVYAIKEVGSDLKLGIVKKISINTSGDDVISRYIYMINESKNSNKYVPFTLDRLDVGDLVTFEQTASTDKKGYSFLTAKEVYKHELIGNKNDLIVKNFTKTKLSFINSKDIIDFTKETFEINGKEYAFDDYIFIIAEVMKDYESGEWVFKSFRHSTIGKLDLNGGDRFVIDELSRIIVVYGGYKE